MNELLGDSMCASVCVCVCVFKDIYSQRSLFFLWIEWGEEGRELKEDDTDLLKVSWGMRKRMIEKDRLEKGCRVECLSETNVAKDTCVRSIPSGYIASLCCTFNVFTLAGPLALNHFLLKLVLLQVGWKFQFVFLESVVRLKILSGEECYFEYLVTRCQLRDQNSTANKA